MRDVRGFAVKFYTEEGNWDIVGNDIPVFFIQDAVKFPDIIHAVKPEPHNDIPQGQSAHNNFWDFAGLQPECKPYNCTLRCRWLKCMEYIAAHMVMWAMSDRGTGVFVLHLVWFVELFVLCLGIPRSFRMMQGFGVNTFSLVNAQGERHFVKFHWIPELGVHSLMWDESLKISGQDPGM